MVNKCKMNREFMKSASYDFDLIATADIAHGVPQPAFQKPVIENALVVDLPAINSETAPKADFFASTTSRMSRRAYTTEPMSLFELAFLSWCTQGVKKVTGGYYKYIKDGSGRNYFRPVPVGGSTNAYETYLAINKVAEIDPGIWRYLPLTHQMMFVKKVEDLPDQIADTFNNPSQNQSYAAKAAALFFWACLPYRGEWRYKETAHKILLIDLGHIGQQLYLATEALGCGCCEIGGYHQKKADALIGVDGEDEFTVLCAAVGHVPTDEKDWLGRIPDIREASK
jgi:SagB-type dehydrogenase family enzyme